MLLNRLVLLVLFLLPAQAWSAYDMEKIKNGITQQPLFKVSEWEQSEKNKGWVAKSQLKYVSIFIGETKSQFIAPYINSKQMKSAKLLCTEFAALAIEPANNKELNAIKSSIRKATTRHHLKFMNMNGVKFSVTPKLIGSVVSLHCSVKTL